MSNVSIDSLVQEWLRVDANPQTRAEIIELQQSNQTEELELRLRDRIAFGTAGLRARMEAGFSRMNDVTVLQASQGLAQYVLSQHPQREPEGLSIVVGHDHRHNSRRFAELTATAFLLQGIRVYYLGPEVVATPLVPFTVDTLGASCGVMVTASHNPARDNGYKVYWGNGCQIVPPHDAGIADAISRNLEPVEGSWDTTAAMSHGRTRGLLEDKRQEMVEKYLRTVEQKLVKSNVELTAVYTPMHGVGLQFVTEISSRLGLELIVPQEQAQPNPDFPTVAFPNPEERGALDLAMRTADANGVDLVLANDPDADRFSAAVKHDGNKWRQLTGNEIGFLFADYIAETVELDGKTYMLNSTVSSQMIKSVAQQRGFQYEDTLTGFKWIGNKAIDLEHEGYKVPFAYEEAIGFMFDVVHDKDGISALAVFAQLYHHWKTQGITVWDRLANGFERYGYYKEFNGYYLVPDLSTTPKIFNEVIRKYAGTDSVAPESIGAYKVEWWRDLTTGYDSSTADNKPALPVDASSQMITVVLVPEDTKEFVRFTARGSGTEPKLKVYIEGKAESESRAAWLAQDVWKLLKEEWFQPEKFNLVEKC